MNDDLFVDKNFHVIYGDTPMKKASKSIEKIQNLIRGKISVVAMDDFSRLSLEFDQAKEPESILNR